MDSDSGDDAAYDDADFVLADNSNTNSILYYSSARHASATLSSCRFVSSALNRIAQSHLSSNSATICRPNNSNSFAVADSGATDTMLPDYSAFISYRRQHNRWVTLGDTTKVPILGEGTAKIKLNGKTIILRRCLHVPELRNPLYSLRRHRHMPGCGTYSDYDHGAFILFPRFTLQIDDTEPIGRTGDHLPLDYVEPRVYSPPLPLPPLISASLTLVRVAAPPSNPIIHKAPESKDPITVPTDSLHITDKELLASTTIPLSPRLLSAIHANPTSLPPVPPHATPAAIESRTTFDPLKLHRIFGCRRFKNQQHATSASKNATLLQTGELPTTIGDFTTINNPPRGKLIKKRRQFLNKVHMDIVFGDCLSLGGFKYALLLVDVATRYCWMYGLPSLTSSNIIDAFASFTVDAGGAPKTFHADFDKKLIGGKALRWLQDEKIRVIAAPASRQSSNGLVERTWQTIVRMARSYLSEKQMGREFWFYAVKHSARMINQLPGRLGRKLISPFELVHGIKPDATTWFELFSVGFFKHSSSSDGLNSKMQSMSMAGIAVGRDDTSNTILFYNPLTRSYYQPQAFTLDESRLPSMHWPHVIRPDGALTCGLLRHNTDPISEPFPPGTRVRLIRNDTTVKGTIASIPLSPISSIISSAASPEHQESPDTPQPYVVHLDDGTTTECTFEELVPPETTQLSATNNSHPSPFSSLPSWLQQDSKITMDCCGSYHKGYLDYSRESGFRFILIGLKPSMTSPTLDNSISFLRPSSVSPTPSANFVSAAHLLHPCPPSLLKALHPDNPDRDTWIRSYDEEKGGLTQHNVFERINKKTYLALKRSGHIGNALPSMCILVIKHNKDGKPNRAKSRIVVLGNFEDRYYDKSQKYAPVLKYTSLRLLTSKASDEEEQFFRQALSSQCNVEFLGPVDYFLGTAFTWQHHENSELSVLLSQTAFTEYMAHRFAVDNMNPIPHMTPYRSGFPIDAIPPPHPGDPDQTRRTKCYQSIVGCINWLATCTRPDVSPVLTFLASYSNNPAPQHYKAALHAVKYLLSTSEYGISFHSNATSTVQAFNHFPHHHDKEAYSDATPPPSPSDCYNLTGFSDACWGGQFGNAVTDGTPLAMFKYRSLSGFVICRAGGPIAWKSIRQPQTSRSSCEAEILATDACVVDLLHIKHCAIDLGIADAQQTITIYNDNQAAVNWAAAFTTKGTKHINLHENCVREAHHSKIVKITHIPGVINASDLFTKELKDAAHFRRCRDSMMVSRQNFVKHHHCVPAHLTTRDHLPYYSLRSPHTSTNFKQAVTSGHRLSPLSRIPQGSARTVSDRPLDRRSERGVLLTQSVCLASIPCLAY
eukprot:CCRYP_011581-RA/>CCRYP_011581-RA protein AED:0.10 eAED:0.05 QI:0/0/0/1/0/0/6/0/1337